MKILKLLSDWMLVQLEPRKDHTVGGIFKPDTTIDPIWVGRILMIGSGRYYSDKFIPMDCAVGERVCFMAAASDGHKPGIALLQYLNETQRLIRQSDVLLVLPDGIEMGK